MNEMASCLDEVTGHGRQKCQLRFTYSKTNYTRESLQRLVHIMSSHFSHFSGQATIENMEKPRTLYIVIS